MKYCLYYRTGIRQFEWIKFDDLEEAKDYLSLLTPLEEGVILDRETGKTYK